MPSRGGVGEGVEIPLIVLCCGNRDKPWPDGLLGSSGDVIPFSCGFRCCSPWCVFCQAPGGKHQECETWAVT